MINIKIASDALCDMIDDDLSDMTKRAREYVEGRSWEFAVDQVMSKIEEVCNG